MVQNPRLDEEQLRVANGLLDEVRARIAEVSKGDEDLYFAFRRKIGKELTYDERGKPERRKRLKKQLMRDQGGMCADCGQPLEPKGSILDRREAKLGYMKENVELIHPSCDQRRQAARGYTDGAKA